MRRLAFFLLAGVATAQAPGGFEPVASTMDLMRAMIVPASDALFAAADTQPRNDEDWAKLRYQALILIESGNLMMMEGRARDKDQWIKDSRKQMDAAQLALKAIAAKDLNKLVGDVGTAIVESCQSCHEHYMKPADLRQGPK